MKSTFEKELDQYGVLMYRNVGDSMMPLIKQDRDLLIIEKPQGRLKKYDVPLYRRDTGEYVLHRILKVRKQDYVLCGDHRYRREYGVLDRQIIGVLTGIERKGRYLSVKRAGYRLYVHLWCDFFYLRAFLLWLKKR